MVYTSEKFKEGQTGYSCRFSPLFKKARKRVWMELTDYWESPKILTDYWNFSWLLIKSNWLLKIG